MLQTHYRTVMELPTSLGAADRWNLMLQTHYRTVMELPTSLAAAGH